MRLIYHLLILHQKMTTSPADLYWAGYGTALDDLSHNPLVVWPEVDPENGTVYHVGHGTETQGPKDAEHGGLRDDRRRALSFPSDTGQEEGTGSDSLSEMEN